MAVSAEKRSSRVRRQASKKQRKNRTVQVRFSDEELAALDAVCESTGMTRSAVLRSWTVPGEGAGSNPVYVVTKNEAWTTTPSTRSTTGTSCSATGWTSPRRGTSWTRTPLRSCSGCSRSTPRARRCRPSATS